MVAQKVSRDTAQGKPGGNLMEIKEDVTGLEEHVVWARGRQRGQASGFFKMLGQRKVVPQRLGMMGQRWAVIRWEEEPMRVQVRMRAQWNV